MEAVGLEGDCDDGDGADVSSATDVSGALVVAVPFFNTPSGLFRSDPSAAGLAESLIFEPVEVVSSDRAGCVSTTVSTDPKLLSNRSANGVPAHPWSKTRGTNHVRRCTISYFPA